MGKIVLDEKYEKIQKALYEQHHVEVKNDMNEMINAMLKRISYMIAEGLQLAEENN